MTFRIPATNIIDSDEGFRIEVVSPTEMRYVEDGATWRVGMEFLADDATPIVVYQNTIVTIDDQSGAPRAPSHAHRDEIVENIRAAMRFRQTEIQVM